ncbi:MAG: hypothetical protein M1827_005371 [Pycnora praestabilis]|nr:MAG: hypothetical protein M1827_005371 [Pycnora praestabilis]
MFLLHLLSLSCLLVIGAHAQSIILTGSNTATADPGADGLPTGSGVIYLSYSTTISVPSTTTTTSITLSGTMSAISSNLGTTNGSTTRTASSGTTQSLTFLAGSVGLTTASVINGTKTSNATATTSGNSTSTATAQTPTNTQPCNNWPEFCERKYSNITEVCAHNSPFVRPGNAASNQELSVLSQLNDGIRMLQGQTHLVNGTMYFCHTSCDLLNAGTVEAYLATVTSWISSHPYDVVTILLANGDYVDVGNFTASISNSGLETYAYTPPKIPMARDDWPTLSSMILSGRRAVIFMDYMANQTAVPYILDEFSQMWETPFSPTNQSFPCTEQRPPGLSEADARDRMYLTNHNLNTEISLAGASLLVPNSIELNVTNNVTGFGSLGLMANSCTEQWDYPPRFLLVDYYNTDNGTVFEVAAQQSNVTYSRACCGLVQSGAVQLLGSARMSFVWVAGLIASFAIVL